MTTKLALKRPLNLEDISRLFSETKKPDTRTILAPTDFSPLSKNAVNYAADLAASVNASLALLHIYQPPMTLSESPLPPLEIERSLREIDENMEQLKQDLLKRTGQAIHISFETRIGGIRSEILSMSQRLQPYAVVMGSHGPGAMERFLLGSNTTWATKHLCWPLIVVPAQAGFKKIERVGLAWNYRRIGNSMFLEKVRDLVKEFKAKLFVVCAIREQGERFSDRVLRGTDELQKTLGELNPQYGFVVDTSVLKGLKSYSEENHLELLIVIPGKHNFPENLFHHSRSSEMALHASLPMLSLHE